MTVIFDLIRIKYEVEDLLGIRVDVVTDLFIGI